MILIFDRDLGCNDNSNRSASGPNPMLRCFPRPTPNMTLCSDGFVREQRARCVHASFVRGASGHAKGRKNGPAV